MSSPVDSKATSRGIRILRLKYIYLTAILIGLGLWIFQDNAISKLSATNELFRHWIGSATFLVANSSTSADKSDQPLTIGISQVPSGVILPKSLALLSVFMGKDILSTRTNKLIVFLNRPEWFKTNDPHYEDSFKGCVYQACVLTDDHSALDKADAVIVFVSRLNHLHPPAQRPSGQVWIAFGTESPVHYAGHHNSPAWRNVFNWTMTYRLDSDILSPYGFLEIRSKIPFKNYTEIALKKSKPIAWFVSNCNSNSKREKYVQELKHHIDVDVYGNCGTLKCPRSNENDCLGLLNSTYYFYLSFENSFCQDYVTEKLFKLYNNVNIIPVVRGGADYGKYFPPKTYINTADFKSPQLLAKHLKTLMADKETYAEMLKAKDQFGLYTSIASYNLCAMCRKLHTSGNESHVFQDFMKWIGKDKCWTPDDV